MNAKDIHDHQKFGIRLAMNRVWARLKEMESKGPEPDRSAATHALRLVIEDLEKMLKQ